MIKTYRQEISDCLQGHGLTGVKGPNTERETAVAVSSFRQGAHYAAKMTQRVGEILSAIAGDQLPPKYEIELRSIFAANKEILDDQA